MSLKKIDKNKVKLFISALYIYIKKKNEYKLFIKAKLDILKR